MAQGWKQVLEDMRHALLGKAPNRARDVPTESAETPLLPDSANSARSEPRAHIDIHTEEGMTPPPEQAQKPATQSDTTEVAAQRASGEADSTQSRPPSRLEWILGAIILVAGAAWLVQASGLWAWWTAPDPPAPDVVATFGDDQITIADIENHLSQLTGEEPGEGARSPQTMMFMVEDMVLDELVRQWAAERKPDNDETFRHTMQHISEDLDLQSFEGQLHAREIPVSESDIRSYYEQNRDQFGDQPLNAVREQIRGQLVAEREQSFVDEYIRKLKENASITRDFGLLDVPEPSQDELRRYYEQSREQFRIPLQVVVDEVQIPIGESEETARQDAADALLQLRSGASWSAVTQSITNTRVLTNTLVDEGMRDPAWGAAVAELTVGELSDVFRAGDTFFIVRLRERRASRIQTFAEARPSIAAIMAGQIQDEWFAANSSKTLFVLKGKRYTAGEFYREYQELPPAVQAQYAGPAGMQDLAERLIERLLLVEDANDRLLDVQNEPLEDEARLQVLKQMLHQEEVDDRIEITDQEIQQYYDLNQASLVKEPRARIRYIRLGLGNSEDEAEQARQRAEEAYRKLNPGLFQSGADFAAVAQEYSEDPETAANGGELPGWIGGDEGGIRTQLEQHAFNDMVLSLTPGAISPPFQFGDSLYIVEVIERTEPEPLDFEEVRPYIEEILRQQKHDKRALELQQELLDQADFQIYWSVLDRYIKQQDPA